MGFVNAQKHQQICKIGTERHFVVQYFILIVCNSDVQQFTNTVLILLKVNGLKCIKLYLIKFSEDINIHLSINPFPFNTDCICKLLYMFVTHYQNKTLYNMAFFSTNFIIYAYTGTYKV